MRQHITVETKHQFPNPERKRKKRKHDVCWCTPAIPVLRRPRQEDHEFEVSLSNWKDLGEAGERKEPGCQHSLHRTPLMN